VICSKNEGSVYKDTINLESLGFDISTRKAITVFHDGNQLIGKIS